MQCILPTNLRMPSPRLLMCLLVCVQLDLAPLQQALSVPPGGQHPAAGAASLPHILSRLSQGEVVDRLQPPAAAATSSATYSPKGLACLADLVAFGDGGAVCDRLTAPLFHFMAHEVRPQTRSAVSGATALGACFRQSVQAKFRTHDGPNPHGRAVPGYRQAVSDKRTKLCDAREHHVGMTKISSAMRVALKLGQHRIQITHCHHA